MAALQSTPNMGVGEFFPAALLEEGPSAPVRAQECFQKQFRTSQTWATGYIVFLLFGGCFSFLEGLIFLF